ncbi:hypothetical protein ABZP36_016395 [Zizania latifolia]
MSNIPAIAGVALPSNILQLITIAASAIPHFPNPTCVSMAFPSFFFVSASVVSAWWLAVVLAAAASGAEEGGDCSPKKCGNLTISPPFWISQRRQTTKACGIRDFMVYCNDSTGVATVGSSTKNGFPIFNISYGERSLLVLDAHKVDDLTSSTNCHTPTWNISAKLGISFKISPANLNLVFYNCMAKPPEAAELRELELMETRCRKNTFARLGGPYDNQSNLDEYSLEGCITTFLPVLLKPGGAANASGYLDLIRGGFLMTWELTSESSDSRVKPYLLGHCRINDSSTSSRLENSLSVPSLSCGHPAQRRSVGVASLRGSQILRCSMPAFPAPAAAAPKLCLAMLLLALRIAASSAADAINTTTSPSCEPANCGDLTIGYPFWLAGTHPPECGYRTFQVSCQQGKASLKNGFWTYQIMSIS